MTWRSITKTVEWLNIFCITVNIVDIAIEIITKYKLTGSQYSDFLCDNTYGYEQPAATLCRSSCCIDIQCSKNRSNGRTYKCQKELVYLVCHRLEVGIIKKQTWQFRQSAWSSGWEAIDGISSHSMDKWHKGRASRVTNWVLGSSKIILWARIICFSTLAFFTFR